MPKAGTLDLSTAVDVIDPHRQHGIRYHAKEFGVSKTSIMRWQKNGIPLLSAERLADNLRFHPTEIWGMAYHAAMPDED